jgi:alanyl-tRNA synthetase
MRSLAVSVSEQLGTSVVVLGSIIKKKVTILVLCSKEAVKSGQHAGTMVSELSEKLGGKGGGKPDFAMGGGKNTDQLVTVLDEFRASNG